MEFLPWDTFYRIVNRYGGDYRVRTFRCSEQLRVMAFAQMTYRESLRDIEACLTSQTQKLYHMGISNAVCRSTLADANEVRDWRIYAELAQRLIAQARKLYSGESLAVDLDNTVYALDSTTIDLCLSMFPWANFRTAKSAVKMHTLLDIRGAIPSFVHISDGKLHDVNVLDMLMLEAGAFYVMDRAYLDFQRLYAMHQAGSFFVTRAKSNLNARRMYSVPVDRKDRGGMRSAYCPEWPLQRAVLSGTVASYPFQSAGNRQDVSLFEQQQDIASLDHMRSVQKPVGSRAVLSMDQTEPSYKKLLWDIRKCSKDSNLDCRFSICSDSNHQKTLEAGTAALHFSTDSVSGCFRENAFAASICRTEYSMNTEQDCNQLNLFDY